MPEENGDKTDCRQWRKSRTSVPYFGWGSIPRLHYSLVLRFGAKKIHDSWQRLIMNDWNIKNVMGHWSSLCSGDAVSFLRSRTDFLNIIGTSSTRLHLVLAMLPKFLGYVVSQTQNSKNWRIQLNTHCFFCRKPKQPSSLLFSIFASHSCTLPPASNNYNL